MPESPPTLKIWKYPLQITDTQYIWTHAQAEPIHAGLDPTGRPCIWFKLDPVRPDAKARVHVVGTGNPMPPTANKHVGSFNQGPYVWHVFTT